MYTITIHDLVRYHIAIDSSTRTGRPRDLYGLLSIMKNARSNSRMNVL